MNYEKKTIIQLKEICKKRKIKGYSRLNKYGIINLLLNNKKGGQINNYFYEKYNNYNNNNNNNNELYHKLKLWFDNLFNQKKPNGFAEARYFTPDELNKLTYFERYLLYLDLNYHIFFNINNTNQEYFKVIYIKNNNNHKRNITRGLKKTSHNIKIIKLKNDLDYINKMIEYFNKNTTKSKTGSCISGIRLRIHSSLHINNNFYGPFMSQFDDEQFCIPSNNPYIKKIQKNNTKKKTRYYVGSVY